MDFAQMQTMVASTTFAPSKYNYKQYLTPSIKREAVNAFYRSGGMYTAEQICNTLKTFFKCDMQPEEVREVLSGLTRRKAGGYDPSEDAGWMRMSQWYEVVGYLVKEGVTNRDGEWAHDVYESLLDSVDSGVDSPYDSDGRLPHDYLRDYLKKFGINAEDVVPIQKPPPKVSIGKSFFSNNDDDIDQSQMGSVSGASGVFTPTTPTPGLDYNTFRAEMVDPSRPSSATSITSDDVRQGISRHPSLSRKASLGDKTPASPNSKSLALLEQALKAFGAMDESDKALDSGRSTSSKGRHGHNGDSPRRKTLGAADHMSSRMLNKLRVLKNRASGRLKSRERTPDDDHAHVEFSGEVEQTMVFSKEGDSDESTEGCHRLDDETDKASTARSNHSATSTAATGEPHDHPEEEGPSAHHHPPPIQVPHHGVRDSHSTTNHAPSKASSSKKPAGKKSTAIRRRRHFRKSMSDVPKEEPTDCGTQTAVSFLELLAQNS